MYLNPTVYNKDFDLMYRISNSDKNFHDERNKNINANLFTFNNSTYFNDLTKTKLIIHSLDIIDGNERIIFIKEFKGSTSITKQPLLEYRNKNGIFANFDIRYNGDSIIIYDKTALNAGIYFQGIELSHQTKGELNYMNMLISPTRSINCDSLKSSNHIKHLKLTIEEQKYLVSNFSQLKLAEVDLEVDARVFGSIEKDSKKYDFCAGIGVIEINNKKYFVDDNLRNYLLKLTNI